MDVFSTSSARLKPWRLSRVMSSYHIKQYRFLNTVVTPNVYRQAGVVNKSRKEQRVYIHHGLSGKEGTNNAGLPRQVTFHIPQPLNTDEPRILSAIKEFRLEQKSSKNTYNGSRPVVVILATPIYTHWLEDKAGFIPKILETFIRHEKDNVLDIHVVCGCVDGLAPSLDSSYQNGVKTVQEGFSILYGECKLLLPSFASKTSQIPTHASKEKSQKEASLTFQTSRPGLMDITLPLANTLFKNGRHSTLLTSRWQVREDGISQTSPQTFEQSLHINISNGEETEAPHAYIPAVPLTVARPIGSGLGNIVRTLVYPGTEGEQPASRELEVKVHEYLKNPNVSTPTIPVWALLIPEKVVTEATTEAASSIRLPGKQYHALYPENSYRDIGHWISKGAIFCRVLSGGGGWGVKAGLLSLDPEIAYDSSPDTWSETPAFPTGLPLSQDISALGNIAEPGSYIQFFTAALDSGQRHPHPHPQSQSQHRQSEPASPRVTTTTVFGTTPSTIDDIPPANAGKSSPTAEASKHELVISREGEFGFVSEKGVYIEQSVRGAEGATRLSSTKIDMPYSYFYKASATGKSAGKRAIGSGSGSG